MATAEIDAGAVRGWLIEMSAEVLAANVWRHDATDAFIRCKPEQKGEYLALLATDDTTRQQRVESLRAVADDCPTNVRAKLYLAVAGLSAGSGDGVPALLTEAAAMLGEAAPPTSGNDHRNEWMYQEKNAGKTHSQIVFALSKEHPEWEQIESTQGIGKAIKEYAKRKNLPQIRRKQR